MSSAVSPLGKNMKTVVCPEAGIPCKAKRFVGVAPPEESPELLVDANVGEYPRRNWLDRVCEIVLSKPRTEARALPLVEE